MYRRKSCLFDRCKEFCRSQKLPQHGPLSFFNIGDNYENDNYKVVFIGKTHWYNKKDVKKCKPFSNSIFRDCRQDGAGMFKERQRGYWYGLRKITDELYPEIKDKAEEILSRIAITNLTKCNTSLNSTDTTPYELTDNCVEISKEEIRILNPQHLVIFTSGDYDQYLTNKFFDYLPKPTEITTDKYRNEKIGKLGALWWHREFSQGNSKMFVLRTRHPERAPSQFAQEVSDWIKTTK
jgi:hypothetical protein